jgi:hypothetical protein
MDALDLECRQFAEYLIHDTPDKTIVERYTQAHQALGLKIDAPLDQRIMDLAVRHKWTLGPLDAICGLRRPRATLRRKLLLLTAILETTTTYSDEFLPTVTTRGRILEELVLGGLRTAALLAVGLPVYWWAGRR